MSKLPSAPLLGNIRKSSGPPPLKPSFKVKGDVHNQRSGLVVAPVSRPQRTRSLKGPCAITLEQSMGRQLGSRVTSSALVRGPARHPPQSPPRPRRGRALIPRLKSTSMRRPFFGNGLRLIMNVSATPGRTLSLRALLTIAHGNSCRSPYLSGICMRSTPLPRAN